MNKIKTFIAVFTALCMSTACIPVSDAVFFRADSAFHTMAAENNASASYIDEFISKLNAERIAEGLQPLATFSALNEAGSIRAKELSVNFSSTRPNGLYYTDVFKEVNIEQQSSSELKWKGEHSIDQIFESFLSSASHKKILMNKNITHIGIGMYYDENADDKYYWSFLPASISSVMDDQYYPGVTDAPCIYDSYVDEFAAELNALRIEAGLRPLATSPAMNQAGDIRAEELVSNFSHTRPNGKIFSTVFSEVNIIDSKQALSCSEAIGAVPGSSTRILKMFLSSESHKKILMNKQFTHIGVGRYYKEDSPYQYYWAIVLANISEKDDTVKVLDEQYFPLRPGEELPTEPPTEESTEPSTEPPTKESTEPSTEAPTKESTEPSTEPPTETTEEPTEIQWDVTPFTYEQDNWQFANIENNLGNSYYISNNYFKMLESHLTNTEKENIKIHMAENWVGSCYGMAATSILAAEGILNPADYQTGASSLHDIQTPLSNDVKSLINYYQMLQYTQNVIDERAEQGTWSEKQKIDYLLKCLEDKSPVLLVYRIRHTAESSTCHAVVAYDVEYGEYSWHNKTYDGKIVIYDNAQKEYYEKRNLFFNSKDGSWTIPLYAQDSDDGSTLPLITDNLALINSNGCLEAPFKYPDTTTSNTAFMELSSVTDKIKAKVATKIKENGGISYAGEDEIDLIPWFTDDNTQTSYSVHFLHNDELYTLNFDETKPVDLRMNYRDSLIAIQASNAPTVFFTPTNTITLDGKAMDYKLQNVLNTDYVMKDWYSITVSGTGANKVDLKPAENGYVLTASNLNDVTVQTFGETASAEITFSADQNSVLIYEIDEKTIGIKADADNDGTYDEEILTQKIGDADGSGEVDILDVITLNKAMMGKETISDTQLKAIDFNKNGKPDSDEALTLLKFIVGIIDKLS